MNRESAINAMRSSPRCCATSKRSGFRCQGPAVKGKRVCRMHGARAGAPTGQRNGNWRHGAKERRFLDIIASAKQFRRLMHAIESGDDSSANHV